MGRISIYIDEDAMDSDLVAALRSRGVVVIAAAEAGSKAGRRLESPMPHTFRWGTLVG